MNAQWMKAMALIAGLTMTAAACGSGSDTVAQESAAVSTTETAMTDDAMSDDDAMEDEEAMEDDAMAMEEGVHVLHLELSGLDSAGSGNDYQVWSVVDSSPVAGGAFDVENDSITINGGQDHLYIFENAASIFITVEPEGRGESDVPSDTQVLAGDVNSDGSVMLAAVGDSSASGTGETR